LSGDELDKAIGLGKPTFAERFAKIEPPPTGGGSDATVDPAIYKPYGFLPTGVGESCDVQRWLDGTEIAEGLEFPYRLLMQIGYVGEEQIKLFLPECIVVIEGQYLRDLRKKLGRRQVHFIVQYSSKVWPTPPAKGQPIIERIELVRPHEKAPHGKNS